MKKLVFSTLAVALATCAFAQTPKSCDLGITVVTPAANTVVNFGDSISVKFDIKNNGTAAIATTDTIYYRLPFGTNGTILYKTGVAIASGASTTVDLGKVAKNTNETGTDQVLDFCIKLLAQSTITSNGNPVTVTYNDPVATNDENCKSNVTIKTKPVSIFDAKTAKETLSLFPNPATSKVGFSIALDKTETVSAIVRDLTGREVMTKNFGQIQSGISSTALELNIANLNSGIYIVEVVAGDKKFIGKVTKKD